MRVAVDVAEHEGEKGGDRHRHQQIDWAEEIRLGCPEERAQGIRLIRVHAVPQSSAGEVPSPRWSRHAQYFDSVCCCSSPAMMPLCTQGRETFKISDPVVAERFLEGLRKAGLPE